MLRVLVDENFDHRFLSAAIRGMDARQLDIVHARESGLLAAPDADVLALAAEVSRVVLTHDIRTLVPVAYQRVREGSAMPGVILVQWERRFEALEDLALVLDCGTADDLAGQVLFLP